MARHTPPPTTAAPARQQRRHVTTSTRAVARDVAVRASQTQPDAGADEPEMTAKTRKLVDAVRAPFRAFSSALADVTATRAELAPAFMRAFEAFKHDTSKGLADFVRELDPSVPVDRDGYRAHRSYQAADYLRRLVANANRPAGGNRAQRPTAATPMDGMARLIRSVLPLIGADQITRLWETIGRELHWSERQVLALADRVDKADPLIDVRPPRGTTVPQLKVVQHRAAGAYEPESERTGTHG